MDAILLLNKPAGMTSFDAVSRCRRVFHERKIGHCGTLDPNASGLMILLLGRYTKFLPYCISNHKHYHATFVFGSRTDSGDIWGQVTDQKTPSPHSQESVQEAANRFLGDTMQVPPMVSAIKVNGRKLYELARKGIEIERKPRPIHVSRMQISLEDDIWHLDAVVSGGTYIRTLITDLGDALGEYAAMSSLCRLGIESVRLDQACTLEQLETSPVFVSPETILDPAIPILEALDEDSVIHGRSVRLEADDPLVIFRNSGQILAAYRKEEDGLYHCQRGLL
ncbi:MAG: tRNA pseudouridine(55) synthase TruB [Solobacterium sp.]|nr:tRNA pseudouridine(55) synthase TruB [Solobacterium sp.]